MSGFLSEDVHMIIEEFLGIHPPYMKGYCHAISKKGYSCATKTSNRFMFCKKHRNYGTGNINVGTNLETDADVKLALSGLWFRLNDKIQRLKQLVVLGEPDAVGESVQDTFQDMSIYGIIAQIVKRKCVLKILLDSLINPISP